MILTRNQILEEIKKGNIVITPFNIKSLQPNSYDFHLGEELYVYENNIVETNPVPSKRIVIDKKNGIILEPDKLYLGITVEKTESDIFSQLIFGDHSIGSLGIWINISAPLAHVGSKIRWTLEIRSIKRVRVYYNMKFGKICFLKNTGKIIKYGSKYFSSSGKYLNNSLMKSLLKEDTK